MSKALTIVWGVWRSGRDFDPTSEAPGLDKTLWVLKVHQLELGSVAMPGSQAPGSTTRQPSGGPVCSDFGITPSYRRKQRSTLQEEGSTILQSTTQCIANA